MQLSTFEILNDVDYSGKNAFMGVSGGINSAAALCYLKKYVQQKPDSLHLYYADFEEHSPDTLDFVKALFEYAKKHFENVTTVITDNSVLDFFRELGMIVPPQSGTCSRLLKIVPMAKYIKDNDLDFDIVGYVRDEYSRIKRQINRGVEGKEYLIRHLSNEDCFSLVKQELGWYPAIYNLTWDDPRILPYLKKHGHILQPNQYRIIREYALQGFNFRSKTHRLIKHNNCFPCKNMHQWEIFIVGLILPDYHDKAMKAAKEMNSYWGRKEESDINESSDCVVCTI